METKNENIFLKTNKMGAQEIYIFDKFDDGVAEELIELLLIFLDEKKTVEIHLEKVTALSSFPIGVLIKFSKEFFDSGNLLKIYMTKFSFDRSSRS